MSDVWWPMSDAALRDKAGLLVGRLGFGGRCLMADSWCLVSYAKLGFGA
jgi:hypothetical protein